MQDVGKMWAQVDGRSPHGERGLKSMSTHFTLVYEKSLSSWRAWIEIFIYVGLTWSSAVALLMESVD